LGEDGQPLDVLLVNLPDPRRENLGLGYLAAVLRQNGYRVEVFEPRSSPGAPGDKEASYVPQILEKTYAVLGLSLYAPGVEEAAHLVQAVRGRRPDVHICLGGNFPTVAFCEILKDPGFQGIDSVVRCEGERTFEELVARVCAGVDWRDVEGIAFWGDGRVISTPTRRLEEDLDQLPFPVRVGTDSFGHETHYGARVCSSRGCYANCSFCGVRAFYAESQGKPWRARSPENVVDEVEHLAQTEGLHTFEFVDDDFMGPGRSGKMRAQGIAQEIVRRKLRLSFSISCRANDVDSDTFAGLKQAGLGCVFLGVESGVQKGLDLFNKGITVKENEQALGTLRRLGLRVRVGFIFFFPQMVLQDVVENLNFLERIIHWGAEPDSGGFNALQVYHGTPIQRMLAESGLLRGNYRAYEYEFSDPDVALLYGFMQRSWYQQFLGIYKSLARSFRIAEGRPVDVDGAAHVHKLRNFLMHACRRAVFHLESAQHAAEKHVRLDDLARRLEAELAIVRSNVENLMEVDRVR
jgi:radical SAM superfamily enzyme YgiQ (UPF0313 family)